MTAWIGATRTRRVVAATLGFVLVAAGSAFAAWVIFAGVHGAGHSTIGSPTTSDAVTLTAGTGGSAVVPGTPGPVIATIVNNTSVVESVTALSASSITASPTCNTSALSFSPSLGSLTNIAASSTQPSVNIGTLTAASNLDPACAGASITVNLTGTTSP